MSGLRLRGMRVLVTRPESVAGRLATAFAREGAVPVCIPMIVIAPAADRSSVERLCERWQDIAVAVFTSVPAVAGCFDLMPNPPRPWPPTLAIGRATAATLCARRIPDVQIPPRRSDSEGLLACPQLDAERVCGRLVAIVKGEGGRDLLARTLRRRGAEVIEANVYRRQHPPRAAAMLDEVRASIDIVTATSAATLDNLIGAASWVAPWLARRVLVTAGERVADIARAYHLSRIIVAEGADDEAIVEATVRGVAGTATGGAVRRVC